MPTILKKSTARSILRQERWTVVIFALFAAVLAYKAIKYRYTDFIFNYPFISYDGFQWITDSLHYLDHSIDAVHRNPALPLTFALLRVLDLVDWFQLVIAFVTLAFYAAGYWLMRAFVSGWPARLMLVWFFFVFRIHAFFDFVLSDPWCIVLITAGIGCLVRLRENPRYLVAAGGAFGLALNYQFAPAFMSPALIWFVLWGLGWDWLRKHRGVAGIAVALFLVLALPQFIYKWIAYGSPLYSHVIHFPLLAVHFYGLPYYAVNFFAFLGWPLGVVVLIGLFRSFGKQDIRWQLIHLSAFCMFVFWIVSYLWLDVRFLLYLVPFWMVYGAWAAQSLRLPERLRWSGQTLVHNISIFAAVYVALTVSAHKVNPFESTLLPLFPQVGLRFSAQNMTEWEVGAISLDKLAIEYGDHRAGLGTALSYFKYYRSAKRSPREYSDEFMADIHTIAGLIGQRSSGKAKVGLCGDLGGSHESKMRLKDAFARNIVVCEASNPSFVVARITGTPVKGYSTVLYSGKELVLLGDMGNKIQ